MKKLISILMCLVLSLSMAMAIGCGNSEGTGKIFEGKYTETTSENLKTYAAEVDKVEDAEDLNFAKGLAMNYQMTMNMKQGEENLDIEMLMNIRTSIKDGKFKMSAVSTTDAETDVKDNQTADMVIEALGGIDMELYFNDNNYYAKMEDAKYYIPFNVDDAVDAVEEDFETALDYVIELDDAIEMITSQTGAKLYIDESGDNTKIKIEAKASAVVNSSSNEGTMTIVFVFDKNHKLVAYQMEMTSTGKMFGTSEGSMTVKLGIEPYSGNVDMPKDLDTYTKAGDSLDDLITKLTLDAILGK